MTTEQGAALAGTQHGSQVLGRSSAPFVLLRSMVTVLLLAIACAGTAHAESSKKPQKPYALIFGTIWDSQSRPAYGIRIKIRRDDQKKAKWELVSDHRGEFAQRVPAGPADYVIWAETKSKKGQKGSHPVETKVHVENDERVDVALHLTE